VGVIISWICDLGIASRMDFDSVECVSSNSIEMDEDEIIHHHHPHPQFASSKLPHTNNGVVNSAIHPATSVHELLECPVCTNSMYPPIHQVCFLFFLCSLPFLISNFVLAFFLNFPIWVSDLWQFGRSLSVSVCKNGNSFFGLLYYCLEFAVHVVEFWRIHWWMILVWSSNFCGFLIPLLIAGLGHF